MNRLTKAKHLYIGMRCGRLATCGKKIDYKSELSATKAAVSLTAKHKDGKVLEAYPCFWCRGWHIGRKMTQQ